MVLLSDEDNEAGMVLCAACRDHEIRAAYDEVSQPYSIIHHIDNTDAVEDDADAVEQLHETVPQIDVSKSKVRCYHCGGVDASSTKDVETLCKSCDEMVLSGRCRGGNLVYRRFRSGSEEWFEYDEHDVLIKTRVATVPTCDPYSDSLVDLHPLSMMISRDAVSKKFEAVGNRQEGIELNGYQQEGET